MSQQDKFDRIIAALHEAMLDDTCWREASALIDDTCGLTGNHLTVSSGHSRADAEFLFGRLYYHGQRHEEAEREYPELYFPHDERIPRLLKLPDSRLVHVTDVFTERELKTSITYNEGLPRYSGQNGLNVRLDGPDGLHIVWAIADPSEPGGWWRSEQLTMLERLLPHVRQFVRVRQALASAEALNASLIGLLYNTRVGVIYLDRRGRIFETNARARDLL